MTGKLFYLFIAYMQRMEIDKGCSTDLTTPLLIIIINFPTAYGVLYAEV
jgi:hypothetical protein